MPTILKPLVNFSKKKTDFSFASISVAVSFFLNGKASKFQPQESSNKTLEIPQNFTNFSGRQTWEVPYISYIKFLKSHQLGASNNQSLKNWTQVEHGWSINTKLTNQNS